MKKPRCSYRLRRARCTKEDVHLKAKPAMPHTVNGSEMKKPPQPSEAQIQRAILEYLQLKGIFCWRVNTGAMRGEYKGKPRFVRFGMPGVSDIVGIVHPYIDKNYVTQAGRFLAIEVKSRKGKLSLAQKSFLDAVRLNGGIAIIAYSLDDVVKVLGKEVV